MKLELSSRSLYDAAILVYRALAAGEKNVTLSLTIEHDADPLTLLQFLELLQELSAEFSITPHLECMDMAGLLA